MAETVALFEEDKVFRRDGRERICLEEYVADIGQQDARQSASVCTEIAVKQGIPQARRAQQPAGAVRIQGPLEAVILLAEPVEASAPKAGSEGAAHGAERKECDLEAADRFKGGARDAMVEEDDLPGVPGLPQGSQEGFDLREAVVLDHSQDQVRGRLRHGIKELHGTSCPPGQLSRAMIVVKCSVWEAHIDRCQKSSFPRGAQRSPGLAAARCPGLPLHRLEDFCLHILPPPESAAFGEGDPCGGFTAPPPTRKLPGVRRGQ